jgi:hypothetical protein
VTSRGLASKWRLGGRGRGKNRAGGAARGGKRCNGEGARTASKTERLRAGRRYSGVAGSDPVFLGGPTLCRAGAGDKWING